MKKFERTIPPDPPPSSKRHSLSSRPPPPPSSRPAPSSASSLLPPDTLLYVEDDDASWLAAYPRLKRSYNLLRAANDREACAAIVEHKDTLVAILMDIELRGSALDGIQLTRLLRGRIGTSDLPPYAQAVKPLSVPVLFVTTPGVRASEAELLAAGGNKVLAKPIDFLQLTSALTHLRLQRIMDLSSPWKE